ncbi:zinc-binding dehydrogenase [Labedaea rhizosphaerae]|uniref:NADPH:quinone reductase-like Zn-dependent oxidoreductase n=1 Tax=Labedaea rhizosphaerae TaxID=598644 RepID=A0A4R6SG62_LABRH|nr:zinc-binding dehydrogenase [Labedaea rhizosphaerae]TDQ01012.1 NADPH:quinone reductase-like Zn-dependent oxidoreductase [Labedaea rhizosphaerae]
MRAIRQYEFGPPQRLRYERVDDPAPGPGQVRIAVAAAGVHFIDTAIRAGRRFGPPLPSLPMTPGREVAGLVESIGDGVDPAWLGVDVVAHLGMASGGYAELAVADVAALHRRSGLDPSAAVAMVGTGRTTMGLLGLAALRPDDVVLVTSAAGGIGTLLVQAARAVGATVIGVAGGAEKIRRVLLNGASIVADYTGSGWYGAVREQLYGRRVSVVFDGVGGSVATSALRLLGDGGRMLTFGWSSGASMEYDADEVAARGIKVVNALAAPMPPARELAAQALAEATAGRWVPAVQAFPLASAAEAHQALEERRTSGKVVLLPAH